VITVSEPLMNVSCQAPVNVELYAMDPENRFGARTSNGALKSTRPEAVPWLAVPLVPPAEFGMTVNAPYAKRSPSGIPAVLGFVVCRKCCSLLTLMGIATA
jgi:hypothetical protein